MEPSTRRPRKDDTTERRTYLLAVRMRPSSMVPIRAYAKKKNLTEADAVRALLRRGLVAEGEIQ